MDTFFHPITIVGPTGEQRTIDALVDSGSTFTSIPADILNELAVEPRRDVEMRLANGATHTQKLGRAIVQLDGLEEITFVIFGEPESPPVIGAVTLETVLLGIDPAGQRLVPVAGWRV